MRRPPAGSIPDAPGSYQFKDQHGRVIYVGKAKSLRSRLSNYFGPPATLLPRTRQMVAAAETVEWIEVRNEVEALFLEYNLIKEHRPRFNIRLKDDKSYPFLAVTLDEKWPRAMVMRGAKRKGVRYFGPYAHAYAIRETLDLLLRTFPIRTCTNGKFLRHERLGRPCLYAHIEKCVAPCVKAVTEDDYRVLVDDMLGFLAGDTAPVITRLETLMAEAADELEFERAARVRDQLVSVRKAVERQQMVGTKEEDLDVIGLVEDELEASVQIFFVRRGRVVGRKGIVIDKVEDLDTPALSAAILEQVYGDATADDVPREVLLRAQPEDLALYEEFLTLVRGSKVRIRVPQRGDRRTLLETVEQNAQSRVTPGCSASHQASLAPRLVLRCSARTRCLGARRQIAANWSPPAAGVPWESISGPFGRSALIRYARSAISGARTLAVIFRSYSRTDESRAAPVMAREGDE